MGMLSDLCRRLDSSSSTTLSKEERAAILAFAQDGQNRTAALHAYTAARSRGMLPNNHPELAFMQDVATGKPAWYYREYLRLKLTSTLAANS
jgi:hypothetical protein